VKKVVVFLGVGLAALVTRTILYDHLTRHVPDLLLIVVVYLGIFRDPVKGLPLVFLFGYLADLLAGGGYVGLTSAIYLGLFLLARLSGRVVYALNPMIQGIIVAAAAVLQAPATGVILHGFGVLPSAWPAHLPRAIVQALVTGLVAPAVFWALVSVDARIAPDEPRHRGIGGGREWGDGWAR
jgi:rod shape-determining protein MreD